MKRVGRLSAAIGAALAGVGAAVVLHPRSGARHRTATAGAARRQSANVATLLGVSVGRASRHRRPSDAQLAEDVRDQLRRTFGDAADGIQVSSHHRTVTLRGEVAQLDDIDAYEACARSAEPRDVNNLLRLAVPQRETPPLSAVQ
jgi:osmotically-inducible protein OsmY